MMKTVLRNFGNSVGLVIPKAIREKMLLQAGQSVQLVVCEQGLLIQPLSSTASFDELLHLFSPRSSGSVDLSYPENISSTDRV